LEEHGTALIEVADTGCGIDAADYASVGEFAFLPPAEG
jgi:DNA mismatch repair ATPase MutL